MKPLLALLSLLALPVMAAEPTIYGRYENIALPELGETLKPKMDTGAFTASLSAKDCWAGNAAGPAWRGLSRASSRCGDGYASSSLYASTGMQAHMTFLSP